MKRTRKTASSEKIPQSNEASQHFTALYYDLKDTLILCGFRVLRDNEEVKDVIDQVFTDIWEGKLSLPTDTNKTAYLCTVVKNRCVDRKRSRRLFQKFAYHQHANGEPVTQTDPAANKELATQIRQAIKNLPKSQRKVMELLYSGHSLQEMVKKTGKSLQTVKNLLTIAKKNLRIQLAHYI